MYKLSLPAMVTAALLSGAGVAVANQYLNFSLVCNSNSGSANCPNNAVLFQGSIDVTSNTSQGNHSGSVILSSATVYLNGGSYSSTGTAATALGTNSAPQVDYRCNSNGQCRVTSVDMGVQTASGAYYFRETGDDNLRAYTASYNGSTWSYSSDDRIVNDMDYGCVGAHSGDYCTLASQPLHHPEINGATLPKAGLLLGSLLLLMRERKRVA